MIWPICLIAGFSIEAIKAADLYPVVHAIIREAEIGSAKGSQSSDFAGMLYARAGYLEDAQRILGDGSLPYSTLWVARAVYLGMATAEASVDSISAPEKRANGLLSLADLFWKTGNLDSAKARLSAAKQAALKVSNLQHRQKILASVALGSSYMGEMPPQILSAEPHPNKRQITVSNDAPPAFPITPEGLGELSLKGVTDRTEAQYSIARKAVRANRASGSERLAATCRQDGRPVSASLGDGKSGASIAAGISTGDC